MSNIYVASSWRNQYQQRVVSLLRELGHEVYDFRNPSPDNHGFSWSEIRPSVEGVVARRLPGCSPPPRRPGRVPDGHARPLLVRHLPDGHASRALGQLRARLGHGGRQARLPLRARAVRARARMFSEARILTSELELRAYFRDK